MVTMLLLMAGLAIAAREPSRVIGSYQKDSSVLTKGKYYQVTQGNYRSEKNVVPIDGKTRVEGSSSTWHEKQTGSPPIKQPFRMRARAQRGLHYGTSVTQKQEDRPRQNMYARRTLGGNQVKDPVRRVGRFYKSTGTNDPVFTDLVTGKTMRH